MLLKLFILVEIIILSLISILILDKAAKKFNIYDKPNKLKIHKKKVTKTSGFGIILLIINSFIFFDYPSQLNYSLNILILFILIGFYDDIKGLDATSKIILMIIPTILYVYEIGLVTSLGEYNGFRLELKSLSFLFTLGCVLLLTNAYNYIDGMDGLLATLSLTSLLFFLVILPKSEINFIYPFIIFLIIFLIFNLNISKLLPKVFIGDSGSIGIGFLFCVIVIHYTQNQNFLHESVAIWFIAFVVYEFLTINIIRLKNNKNPFQRDLNFIFNQFLKKYSKTTTLILCNSINLFFCIFGCIIQITNQYVLSIILFPTFFFVYLFFRLKQR